MSKRGYNKSMTTLSDEELDALDYEQGPELPVVEKVEIEQEKIVIKPETVGQQIKIPDFEYVDQNPEIPKPQDVENQQVKKINYHVINNENQNVRAKVKGNSFMKTKSIWKY